MYAKVATSMYQLEEMATQRQRTYLEEASRTRRALRLRALHRAARRAERAERRMRHARNAVARLRTELEL
jgi:7,8-dihydro-6-hydroxymethylpterin-pyrophosphokinase